MSPIRPNEVWEAYDDTPFVLLEFRWFLQTMQSVSDATRAEVMCLFEINQQSCMALLMSQIRGFPSLSQSIQALHGELERTMQQVELLKCWRTAAGTR